MWKYEFFRKNKSPFLTNGLKCVIIIIGILKTAGGVAVDFGERHYFHLPKTPTLTGNDTIKNVIIRIIIVSASRSKLLTLVINKNIVATLGIVKTQSRDAR